jgi:hypothetical protein
MNEETHHGSEVSFPQSQKEAGTLAGLSRRQRETAIRLANVGADDFDATVESETPPTITKLAEAGTRDWSPPSGFAEATKLLGTVRRFAEFCGQNEPELAKEGLTGRP